jgi:hypothetical protein
MRLALGSALLSAVCVAAGAAETPPPKASDVLKPPGAREIASPINDRFALRVSYFPASVSTDIRLDNDNGLLGTELSAENDLGMRDKDDQARIELTLRLRDRNRIRFDYFKLTRKGDEVLTRTLNFGDETFLVSDRVTSLLDWRTLNFTYLYSVFHNPRFELGAGFGIHILDGEARAQVPARQVREEDSAVAPFPSLALDATWRFARRFSLSARGNYLSADVDESTGLVSDWHADVQYRLRRNLALGLGYTSLRTHVDIADGDFPGRLRFDVDGPEFFFRASF